MYYDHSNNKMMGMMRMMNSWAGFLVPKNS